MFWNKGNAKFTSKKAEIELLIEEYSPSLFGIIEANMEADCHPPVLKIDGFKLERDNLCKKGIKTRTAVYINEALSYRRREDLEPTHSPTIWLEIDFGTKFAWLAFFGYREWRSLGKNKKHSGDMAQQLVRLNEWQSSWSKAETEGLPMIIMGDFNIDVRPWTSPNISLTDYQKSMTSVRNALINMAQENNLNII